MVDAALQSTHWDQQNKFEEVGCKGGGTSKVLLYRTIDVWKLTYSWTKEVSF